mgnify:CR=1 FL=1
MKIKDFSSSLSCITNCIRIFIVVINKKIILRLFIVSLLGACSAPTAMLGPAYTYSSSGNLFQTGLTYTSNEVITKYTGKTPLENIKQISESKSKDKNIKKQTLESDIFINLIKNRVKKTNIILKYSNQ